MKNITIEQRKEFINDGIQIFHKLCKDFEYSEELKKVFQNTIREVMRKMTCSKGSINYEERKQYFPDNFNHDLYRNKESTFDSAYWRLSDKSKLYISKKAVEKATNQKRIK